jgi:diguanylate cyclase (GGDEF)-like protein/PAS domain S-box-containing protein
LSGQAGRRAPAEPSTGDRVGRAAANWAAAIWQTSVVPVARGALADRLRPLVEQLFAAAGDPDGGYATGTAVGGRLVAEHFTDPEALARTLIALDPALPAGQRGALTAGLAAGYTAALRGRTLAEQETIRLAAMQAQARAERALSAAEARFHAVYADSAMGIALTDLDGRVVAANGALHAMLRTAPGGLTDRDLLGLVHPDDRDSLRDMVSDRLATGTVGRIRTERRLVADDGELLWALLAVSVVRDPAGRPTYLVVMGEDNTRRHHLADTLSWQATHDTLTGLANRTLFTERLQRLFARGTGRLGLCFLDLDGFKIINDSLGHHVGDELLRHVADRIAAAAGSDSLVARLGGDEFMVLRADSAGEAELVALADRILAALDEPITVAGHELSVSASIGVIERATLGTDAAELMRAADITLYWAKAAGKGCWATFDPERDAQQAARQLLAEALPGALREEQFTLAYQPVVDLADRRVTELEALVRWRHPRLGELGPEAFLGIAEETGLVVPLGRWVLHAACAQARRWLDRYGWAPVVSVNLTVRQVCAVDLVDDVRQALAAADLPAHALQLEVTERALIGAEPVAALRSLYESGVRIVIDDFGTGYSNLVYLRQAPVHGIKLARSFTESFNSPSHPDRADVAIVRALVSLAHTLNLTVTAGGVETARQESRLRALGCEWGQGFRYGRPAVAAHIDDLLAAGRTVAPHG